MFRTSSTRFLLQISLFVFVALTPPARSMSFNLTGNILPSPFCRDQKAICLSGNATSAGGVIQLTTNQVDTFLNYSVGRAYYSERLRLWDRSTGELTNFTTNFSIAISSKKNNRELMADGMAFFLSNSEDIPPGSNGGYLGLMSKGNTSGLVAVEFDSYANADTWDGWDPAYRHIGIDINSIESVSTAELYSRYNKDDIKGKATVRYDAITKNFSVMFIYEKGVVSVSYIVDLRNVLSEWVWVGFSGATGQNFELNTVTSWEFESTLDVILQERNKNLNDSRAPNNPVLNGTGTPHVKEEKKSNVGLLVGLVVGGLIFIVVVSLALFGVWQRRNKPRTTTSGFVIGGGNIHLDIQGPIDEDLENERGPRQFPYIELSTATNDFSNDKRLGVGGFGAVYKGLLPNSNLQVAIKRLSKDSKQGTKEYISEVKIISRLRHKNLVPLVGWCHELSELLLVYEFMANGSLDNHLFNNEALLSWQMRYNIVLGLASALLYLHTEWIQCVVHRDIKTSNVMLDDEFNAKLGDFGLARLTDHGSAMKTTIVAGTLGYMAPECYMTSKSSKESDVYSFGIVLLEIACGRRAIESSAEPEKVQLLDWVWRLYGMDQVVQAADQKLEGAFDKAQIERVIAVGLWCANPDLDARPSIRQALSALTFEAAAMPYLPRKMPVPVYSSSPMTNTVGEFSLQPSVTTTSASYSAIPCTFASGTDYSSTMSSKSDSSSTSLLASAEQ